MTTAPRSPHLLLLCTLVLAAAGVALLFLPVSRPSLPSPAPTGPAPPAAAATTVSPTTGTTPSVPAASSAGAGLESAMPPHGDGPTGDHSIQQGLEHAWPADLSPRDQQELLRAGRSVLRADATGIGRNQWPTVFPDVSEDQAVAPAFATARFRIQAAVARREGNSPDRAVVHLVWAGADRGGTYTDGRITDLYFTRTTRKGITAWDPQP
ncbi:hypothetical protein O3S80_27175, partial [Streptomyces sp. Lzd4kr]|nr:hypothetical protein [Streptomyces sp. Lzd4kr]